MFRLHIDIPLGDNEEIAGKTAQEVVKRLVEGLPGCGAEMFQYRMGCDGDRTIKNHLIKTENGHATRAKVVISL